MTNSLFTRWRRVATLALAAGTVAVAISAPASAQERRTSPIVAVVDTEMLVQESLAAKGVQLEREKYVTLYTNQVKDQEAKLRQEDTELTQQRATLAPDVFQQRLQAFQQKVQDFQSQVKDKQERLEFSYQQSMREVGQSIVATSQEIGKQQGYNLVVARGQLLYWDASMDITKAVLDRLNQKLTTVKFQDPATLSAPTDAAAAAAQGKAPAPAPAKK